MQKPSMQSAADTGDNEQSADPSENQSSAAGDDYTEIALRIRSDGSMTVALEINDDESQAQETPVSSLDDGLRTIKKIATQVMAHMPNPEQDQENAAFQQEMAS